MAAFIVDEECLAFFNKLFFSCEKCGLLSLPHSTTDSARLHSVKYSRIGCGWPR